MTQFVLADEHRNTLTVACQRVGTTEMTASQLADALNQPSALKPMGRKELFGAVSQIGGDPAVIGQLYAASSAYMADVETALRHGDLPAAYGLIQVCPITLPPATYQAIAAVLQANTLRFADVVAAELGEPHPQAITASDVTTALEDARYMWDTTEWKAAVVPPVNATPPINTEPL